MQHRTRSDGVILQCLIVLSGFQVNIRTSARRHAIRTVVDRHRSIAVVGEARQSVLLLSLSLAESKYR